MQVILTDPHITHNSDFSNPAIFNANHDSSSRVALISGGGAGHEPAHAAFVGTGMLSAAVSGNIFASPSASQIFETIRTIGGKSGTVLIIKNYTGDVFHFHIAAEQARAQLGNNVEVLVVADDVAVGKAKNGKVGRRGLAGTILVHKILGAMSASGKPFNEILQMGKDVIANLVTCGVSQGHVRIPGTISSNSAKEEQMELGMGIHNEPGCHVLNPRPKLDELLAQMLDMLTSSKDADRSYVHFNETSQVVLLVNNLGGTSVLELTAITNRVLQKLREFAFVEHAIHSSLSKL
jgi:dihydroxyacetone kinase